MRRHRPGSPPDPARVPAGAAVATAGGEIDTESAAVGQPLGAAGVELGEDVADAVATRGECLAKPSDARGPSCAAIAAGATVGRIARGIDTKASADGGAGFAHRLLGYTGADATVTGVSPTAVAAGAAVERIGIEVGALYGVCAPALQLVSPMERQAS